MPYIAKGERNALDPKIDALLAQMVLVSDTDHYAGTLNYVCTTIAIKFIKSLFGRIHYQVLATVTGVFHNILDEFYRRVGTPYESSKIHDNGDVGYDSLLEGIDP